MLVVPDGFGAAFIQYRRPPMLWLVRWSLGIPMRLTGDW